MTRSLSRREFLATAGAVALGSRLAAGQDKKLRHATVGCGGMGGADLGSISSHPAIRGVALCDVDTNNLAGASKKFPNAKQYRDFRKMFAEIGADIDTVSCAARTCDPHKAMASSRTIRIIVRDMFARRPSRRRRRSC